VAFMMADDARTKFVDKPTSSSSSLSTTSLLLGTPRMRIASKGEKSADATPHARPFDNGFQDFSKINTGVHDATRSDTFQTPGKADKKFTMPGALDKRYGLGDSYTMIDICEKAFLKGAERISSTILTSVREVIEKTNTNVQKSIADSTKALIDIHEANVNSSIVDMRDQLRLVQERAEQPACIDFAPMRDMLQMGTEAQLQGLQNQLSGSLAHVFDEVTIVRKQQDQIVDMQKRQVLDELHWNREEMKRCSTILETLSEGQRSSEKTAKELHDELTLGLKNELGEKLSNLCSTMDSSVVLDQLNAGQGELRIGILELMAEIARIQRSMNVDYRKMKAFDGMRSEMKSSNTTTEGPSRKSTSKPEALRNLKAPEPVDGTSAACTALQSDGAASEERPGKLLSLTNMVHMMTDKNKTALANLGLESTRLRDYFTQTDSRRTVDSDCQTDARMWKELLQQKSRKSIAAAPKRAVLKQATKKQEKPVFANADAMKENARRAKMKPAYNVFDLYKESGMITNIAKSSLFENLTFFVIVLNALWISIDMDNNNAAMLHKSEPIFLVAENTFCLYFTGELIIRFIAFKSKSSCLRDFWFVFDGILVLCMILETWVVVAVFIALEDSSGGKLPIDLSVFRLTRMAKMVRITRMARLLREMPELLVLLKGIGAALRTVIVFSALWLIIIYVFAIIFSGTSERASEGVANFESVLDAMETLLLKGVLPVHATFISDVVSINPWFWPIILFYIVLASMTLLNMLVGVMVTTISAIAAAQTEGMTTCFLASQLRTAMAGRDPSFSPDAPISKEDFQQLMVDPDIEGIINEAGVDVMLLLDSSQMLFEKIEKDGGEFNFEKFIDLILNNRGGNPASVRDVKEQLKLMKGLVKDAENDIVKIFSEQFETFRQEMEVRDNDRDMEMDAMRQAEPCEEDGSAGTLLASDTEPFSALRLSDLTGSSSLLAKSILASEET
jgi:hypothetical protein